MAGKTYIKTSDNTWAKIKKVYLKTGGQTWTAVRKAYIKTGTGTWRKVYDTASNKPFLRNNDFPRIRLNSFRSAGYVEAPPVQMMGPSTGYSNGWPLGAIGTYLYGANADDLSNYVSGNGSNITYTYNWYWNESGNQNDDTEWEGLVNSGSDRDLFQNTSTYLGASDGDYFDRNFLTFKVNATNSAGTLSASSPQVYIVRQMPSGTITMVSPGTAATNSSMSATFTYSNNWYNKTNISNSYIEWFAVSSIGESLTNSNRVQIEYLSSIAVTGTTSKSGTSFHTPTIANKYYYVKMTLNNSSTENAVIAISGFTPKSSVTSQANKTVVTGTLVPAPTSLTATSNRGDGVLLQWDAVAGANYYEIYWQSLTGAGPSNQSAFADFGTNNSITTNSFLDTTISPGATRYYRVRARIETTSTGNNCSDWFPAPSSTGTSGFRVKPGPITNPTAYSFTTSTGHGYFTTGANTDSVQYKLQGITIPIATSVNTISTISSYPYKVTLNPSSLFTERTWNYDTYSAATTYYNNNTVWYAGNEYRAKLISFSGSGTVPSTSGSNTYWTRGSFVGTTPSTSRTWSSSTSYTQGQVVYYGTGTSGASVYEYTANDPGFSGQGPTNTTYWTRITTVTYSVGDYVNYNGTRYYVKVAGNGNYPNNTTYWSSTLGTWRFDFVPYFSTAVGDTAYSNSTRDLTLSHTAATEPMTMAAGVSFDNITSSSFRANYTTGLYANFWYIDIYKTSTGGRISGTPYLTHRSNVTAYSDTVSSGVESSTNYTYSITPRYYYSLSPDVFDNGTGSSNTVTTLTPMTAPTITNVPSINSGEAVSVFFTGGSGPAYQMYWTTGVAPTASVTPDATGTSSPLTDNSGPNTASSASVRWFMYVRSVATVGENSVGPSSVASSWSAGYEFTVIAPVVKLATPTNVNATDNRTDGVSVTWNAVSGAAYYGVWYGGAPGYDSTPDFGGPNNPTLITGTSYLDTAISAGSSRDYYVQAFASGNPAGTKSDWGGPNNGTRIAAPVKLSTPSGVNASDNRTDGINITWNAVSGASYYGIWWGGVPGYDNAPDFGGPNSAGGWNGFGTSFLDTAVGAGTTRNYYVQAYASGNPTGTKSDWSAGDSGTRTTAVSAPATPTSVAISGSGLATWSPSSGATSYTVQYYLASNSSGGNASGPYTAAAGSSTSYQVTYQTIGGIFLNYARVRVLASNSGGNSLYSAYTGYA